MFSGYFLSKIEQIDLILASVVTQAISHHSLAESAAYFPFQNLQHSPAVIVFVQVHCKFVPKSIVFPLHGIPFVRKYNNLLDLYSVFPFQLPINFGIQLHGAVNLTFLVTLWSAHHHHVRCLFATPVH